ncbi:hypothetical protein HYX70_00045 [Candidatus Saccharibacteria bacterium]|nr:hypothetical protein [Candidatus Saccharibacteria bacterium]
MSETFNDMLRRLCSEHSNIQQVSLQAGLSHATIDQFTRKTDSQFEIRSLRSIIEVLGLKDQPQELRRFVLLYLRRILGDEIGDAARLDSLMDAFIFEPAADIDEDFVTRPQPRLSLLVDAS